MSRTYREQSQAHRPHELAHIDCSSWHFCVRDICPNRDSELEGNGQAGVVVRRWKSAGILGTWDGMTRLELAGSRQAWRCLSRFGAGHEKNSEYTEPVHGPSSCFPRLLSAVRGRRSSWEMRLRTSAMIQVLSLLCLRNWVLAPPWLPAPSASSLAQTALPV